MIKMNINKTVFIKFGHFMTFQGTFGAVSGIQGPFRGSVWELGVPTVLSGSLQTSIEINWSVSEPHFV